MEHFRKNGYFIGRGVVLFCIIAFGFAFLSGSSVNALVPKVILSSYEIKSHDPSGNIYPGDTFDITFKIKNTAKSKIMNMKCTVSSENGEFIPVDSTGSVYINEINGEAEAELSFEMSSLRTLEEKAYKIIVKSEYEDWNGKYEDKETIYIPVKQRTEIVISDTYIAEEEVRLGDNIEIVSTVNNVGGTTIYKVTAKSAGDNIAEASTFIGNIAPGKSGNIDLITRTTNVSSAATYKNRIIVTYEDADGKQYSEEVMLGDETGHIEVLEQDFSDIIQIKEDTTKHMSNTTRLLIVLGWVLLVALVIVGLIIRKRRRLEREFD